MRHAAARPRSERRRAGNDRGLFRVLPALAAGCGRGHAGGDRGRARLSGHRLARGVPGAVRAAARRPRRADHGQPRNRALGRDRLPASCSSAPALTRGQHRRLRALAGTRGALYSTAFAADDLAAMLDALAIGRIDLYGDSYGTYFAQVFALRHPREAALAGARWRLSARWPRLRLVSALRAGDARQVQPRLRARSRVPRPRRQLARAHRTGARAAARGAVRRAGALRRRPLHELHRRRDRARDRDVRRRTGLRDACARWMRRRALSPPATGCRCCDSWRKRSPASTRAIATRSPRKFSAGLAAAVFCEDPPQIFDMRCRLHSACAGAIASSRSARHGAPDTYAPFTIDEYRRMPLDYAFIDECVRWPAPRRFARRGAHPVAARYPDVPVLVVSGELDNMTSVADGDRGRARFPRIASPRHRQRLSRQCAAARAQRMRGHAGAPLHARTSPLAMRAARRRCPAVRLVPRFARHVGELAPAQGLPGNRADEAGLRAVSAALLTCEDVIARVMENGAGRGVGLRGGDVHGSARRAGLSPAVARGALDRGPRRVSGRIDWPGRSGACARISTLLGPARSPREARAAVAAGCRRRPRHRARSARAVRGDRRGARALGGAHRGFRRRSAPSRVDQQPQRRARHGESGAEEEGLRPGVMTREVGDDGRCDQAAGIAAGIEQRRTTAIVSARPTCMIAAQ